MAKETRKVHPPAQPTQMSAPQNTIYSYNHANPHGPFAPGAISKPLMILGGLMLFSALYSFFAASTQSSGVTSFISVIAGLFDILLAIGLLLRLEVARKVIIYASVVIIVLTGLSGLAAYQSIRNLEAIGQKAHQAIDTERQQPLSAAQEAKLQELETQVLDTDRGVLLLKKRMTGLYIYWILTVGIHVGLIVYLSRPNVKSQFKQLQ